MAKDIAKETGSPENKKSPFNRKKLKYGALSTIITVIVIAVIVVINLIAGILTDRKGLKIDLTEEQYYDVSQETIDYLKSIKNDVEIAVTSKESSLNSKTGKMVLETLNKFRQNSDYIAVEFYDVASNPDVITKFSNIYNGEISENNIIVQSNNKVKVINIIYDMFEYQSDYYGGSSIAGYKGEQELLSAVMSVTDANPKRAAFISMYNGSSIYHSYIDGSVQNLSSLMDKNGYQISAVDIMNDEISPENYDMVILPAPVNDLPEACIKKLEDFLYNNGDLDKDMVYIADARQFVTPNIDEFLEVWGIKIGDSIVYESDDSKSQIVTTMTGQRSAPVAQFADTAYSEGLSNTKLPVVVPIARPIELLFDSNVDRTTSAILQTSDTAFRYPLDLKTAEEAQAIAEAAQNGDSSEIEATEEPTEFDEANAQRSVQNLMAVATKSNMDSNNVEHKNNIMVIGCSDILDQILTYSNSYNNAEYVINAVNRMCGKENGVIIAQKDLSAKTISIKASQIKAISRVVIYIIPLIVVAAGIVVFLRRRNK